MPQVLLSKLLTKTSNCKKLSNPLHKFSSSVENHAKHGRFGPEVFSTKHFLAQHTQKKNPRKKQKRERKAWGKNREARVDTTTSHRITLAFRCVL